MQTELLYLVIAWLVSLVIFGFSGFWLRDKWKTYLDAFDSSNSSVKVVQGFIRGVGYFFIFQVFFLPLINLTWLVGYVAWQGYFNQIFIELELKHYADVLFYGVRLMIWLGDNGLSTISRGNGLVEKENATLLAIYVAGNLAFMSSLIGWTIATADDKWGAIKSFFVKVGVWVLATYILSTWVLNKTLETLPESTTLNYIWDDVLKGKVVLNPTETAPAPVTYGPGGKSGVHPTSADAAEQAGFDMMWVYLIGGIVLILALLWFFKFRKKGGDATAGGEGEAGENSADGDPSGNPSGGTDGQAMGDGSNPTSPPPPKEYDEGEYAKDLLKLRRRRELYLKYDALPYFFADFLEDQSLVDRMRRYLQAQNLREDNILRSDFKKMVEGDSGLQSLLNRNHANRSLTLGVLQSDADAATFDFWNQKLKEIGSAAKDGFFLLQTEYSRVLQSLELYAKKLVIAAEREINDMPTNGASSTALYDSYVLHLQIVEQMIQTLQVGYGYGKLYGLSNPNIPGVRQPYTPPPPPPPTPQPSSRFSMPSFGENRKWYLIIGGSLLLLLLTLILILRSGGDTQEEMSDEKKAEALAEVQPMVDSTASFLCQGVVFDSIPVDFKNRANAVMKKWDVSGATFKAQVEKKFHQTCPQGKKKKK